MKAKVRESRDPRASPSRDVSRGEMHQPSSLICTAKFRSFPGTKEEQIRGFELSRGRSICPSRPSLSRRYNYGHQANYITDASRLDTAPRDDRNIARWLIFPTSNSERTVLFIQNVVVKREGGDDISRHRVQSKYPAGTERTRTWAGGGGASIIEGRIYSA